MSLASKLNAMLRESRLEWPWPSERKPLRVDHVRYVTKPAIDPVEKALAMAHQMGRDDLVARLEGVRG